MTLAAGQRLGHFEVLAPLGAGGMGEVYRARDTRLGREVALKLLPETLARSPERRTRFEREARLLATLSHPGIAVIHDFFQDEAGNPVLVMELVEGEALAARLYREPLPVRRALELARQVAEALESAHARGIIHRDLKPGNIQLTPAGGVKLLDFGLARALETDVLASSEDTVATAAQDAASSGQCPGTAPYMSPEQVRGEALDARTDIWSFGCVVYEALAGKRAFAGRTTTEAIAAVLEREPDWAALPAATPDRVSDLLRRCLRKDAEQRLHHIADARIELKDVLDERGAASGAGPARGRLALGWRRGLWLGTSVVAGAILGGVLVWSLLRSQRPTEASGPLTLIPPAGVRLLAGSNPPALALSPDGARLAFVGVSGDGGRRLYVRELSAIDARPLPDTDGATSPFFSPDGRWLAYGQDGQLKKLPVAGGPALSICDARTLRGGSWAPDDTIVFVPGRATGLWRVSASGGEARPLTSAEAPEGHRWPQILPGGRAAVFAIHPASSRREDARIGVVSLDTGAWRVLLSGGGHPRYAHPGYLVYGHAGALLAVPFDAERLAVTGPPNVVVEDVRMAPTGWENAHFDLTPAGILGYVPGYPRPVERALLWVDREGGSVPAVRERWPYAAAAISPDGHKLAVVRDEASGTSLWVHDLVRGTWTRLTGERDQGNPVWSPDGRRLAFTSNRAGVWNVYWMPADGSSGPERLTTSHWMGAPEAISPDGRLFVFRQLSPDQEVDLWILPLEGERRPRLLQASPANEFGAALSPDGRWLAYHSNESGQLGQLEVYVRSFPDPGMRVQISSGGGLTPRWRRGGRELFYRTSGRTQKLMAVSVETGRSFKAGSPRPLFDAPYEDEYDAAADGQRFLMIEQAVAAPLADRIVVIPDFKRQLRARLRGEAGR